MKWVKVLVLAYCLYKTGTGTFSGATFQPICISSINTAIANFYFLTGRRTSLDFPVLSVYCQSVPACVFASSSYFLLHLIVLAISNPDMLFYNSYLIF